MLDTNLAFGGAFLLTKFSKEFRLRLVLEVEGGQSLTSVARRYGVGRTTLQNWFLRYQAGGMEQLIATNQHYTQEFKLQAIEYRKANGLSYAQAAADLGIPKDSTLQAWEKLYLEQGLDGLQDTRKGRPPNMKKKKTKPTKPLSREEELEAENAQLRMENAYLKKLKALVEERERSAKKTK